MKSKIKSIVYNELNDAPFKDKMIIDLDLRTSGIKKGKRSFMKCEVTLFLDYLKNKHNLKSTEIYTSVDNITKKIITQSLKTSKDFQFYKSKH